MLTKHSVIVSAAITAMISFTTIEATGTFVDKTGQRCKHMFHKETCNENASSRLVCKGENEAAVWTFEAKCADNERCLTVAESGADDDFESPKNATCVVGERPRREDWSCGK